MQWTGHCIPSPLSIVCCPFKWGGPPQTPPLLRQGWMSPPRMGVPPKPPPSRALPAMPKHFTHIPATPKHFTRNAEWPFSVPQSPRCARGLIILEPELATLTSRNSSKFTLDSSRVTQRNASMPSVFPAIFTNTATSFFLTVPVMTLYHFCSKGLQGRFEIPYRF